MVGEFFFQGLNNLLTYVLNVYTKVPDYIKLLCEKFDRKALLSPIARRALFAASSYANTIRLSSLVFFFLF